MINIESLIQKDLGCYTQDSGYPSSLTIRDEITWRHYELGEILGFVVWQQDEGFIGIASVSEDDGFFAPAPHPMLISAYWTKYVYETFKRMKEWIDENVDFKNNTLKYSI